MTCLICKKNLRWCDCPDADEKLAELQKSPHVYVDNIIHVRKRHKEGKCGETIEDVIRIQMPQTGSLSVMGGGGFAYNKDRTWEKVLPFVDKIWKKYHLEDEDKAYFKVKIHNIDIEDELEIIELMEGQDW